MLSLSCVHFKISISNFGKFIYQQILGIVAQVQGQGKMTQQ